MNPFGSNLDEDDNESLPDILGDESNESEYSDEDDELFVLEQLAWEPTPTQGKLVAIDVGHDTIIVGTDKRLVILLKVDNEPQLFLVGKKGDIIHNLFVDGDANHLIVTMKNGLNFYINLTSSHLKNSSSRRKQTSTSLSKVKGITIESIVWSQNAYRDSTGLCLIGTSNGCIYSLQISDGKEKQFIKLYDLKTGSYGTSGEQSKIHHSDNTCFRICGLHIEYLNAPKEQQTTDSSNTNNNNDEENKMDPNIKSLKQKGYKSSNNNNNSSSNTNDNNKRFYIIAAIPNKIFEFIGGPSFNDVFKYYDGGHNVFKEIPGSLKHTKLCVYKPHSQMAEAIGWLTEPGIVLCKPVFGSHVTPKSGVIGDGIHENIIVYGGDKSVFNDAQQSKIDQWHGMSDKIPISFVVTQFHLILVYEYCYLVINRLSKECVSNEVIPNKNNTKNNRVISIATQDNFIYVMSSSQIYQIRAQDESRDVWQLFLNKNDFVNAYKYARNNWQKSKILRCEAEYYFNNDHYREAALKYVELSDIAQQNEQTRKDSITTKDNSKSSPFDNNNDVPGRNIGAMREADLWLDVSFEEIALKFLNRGANDALMTFLKEKLNRMHNDDKTQRTILATWLTEMHLSRINQFSSLGQDEDEQSAITDFENFLKSYRTTLSNSESTKSVIFDLIASHGRTNQLVEFARIQQDYKWVINHYIQNHHYKYAIRVLATLQNPHKYEELYYEFAPILMYAYPKETVDMLIKVQSLDPKRLIPALMRYGDTTTTSAPQEEEEEEEVAAGKGGGMTFIKEEEEEEEEKKVSSSSSSLSAVHRNQAIRYLQYCIEKGHEKSKDPAIHNYLISLYCSDNSNEKPLLDFILSQRKKPLFDIKYALRLCHQENCTRSCVELYKIMKLYEEAIRLSLTMPYAHYSLAKSIAKEYENEFTNNKLEQKRLWLIIARYVVDKLQSDEIKEVLDIIAESSILSIEDILPHLKDFTEIGPFKKDIKQSLEKYSQQIIKLQKEMDAYTDNAEEIRSDTKQLLLRSSMITSNRKCDLSGKPILNTQFILFPCTHVFRFDELCKRIIKYKEFKNNKELIEYAKKQCPLCGDMMIDQVIQPFIDLNDENEKKEAESWLVGDEILSIKQTISKNNISNKPNNKTINLDDINIADLHI